MRRQLQLECLRRLALTHCVFVYRSAKHIISIHPPTRHARQLTELVRFLAPLDSTLQSKETQSVNFEKDVKAERVAAAFRRYCPS